MCHAHPGRSLRVLLAVDQAELEEPQIVNQRHLTSSRYSPGNLAPDALERLLVGREQLVEELTQKVRKSVTSAHKHYVLLVGPRGVGKTHLIALVYHRIASTEAFSPIRGKFLVAYLNEEEWGVASFLDFWLVILRSLQAHEPALEPPLADIQLQFESSAERARDAAEERRPGTVACHGPAASVLVRDRDDTIVVLRDQPPDRAVLWVLHDQEPGQPVVRRRARVAAQEGRAGGPSRPGAVHHDAGRARANPRDPSHRRGESPRVHRAVRLLDARDLERAGISVPADGG
ncbi:MAG: ATP-binding protein [Deltaproteobacteria bacterium]|nr:MAG: ATP-binding protein [Deltaproteobacteria bacterium]